MNMVEWFKTSDSGNKRAVYDPVRRRYVALTPEERVRQTTLKMLVEAYEVPISLIGVEYSIKVNGLNKRCDIVIFDNTGSPLAIVECKASSVGISDKVLDQSIRYYSALKPRYLILTNSINTYCLEVLPEGLKCLETLPTYEQMTQKV